MVAFAGYYGAVENEISNMLSDISPYKDGECRIFEGDGCILGQKQLSCRFPVNALEFEGCEGYCIAFSGRLFNASEIADKACCDGEAVLIGFKTKGADIFKELRGRFALAIYDKKGEKLYLARDRFGTRPMYYHTDGQGIAFASNTKAFAHLKGFEKEVNEALIADYLCFGSVPGTYTLIKGVFRLEPGHYIEYSGGEAENFEFAALDFKENEKSIDECIDEIHTATVNAVEKNCYGNYGTFLSGGVDSSYIASVARPKNTFTAGYSDSQFDESLHTRELAKELGIENHVRVITPEEYLKEYKNIVACMDEPLSNPSVPSIYFGAQAASEMVDGIISGEGADELFAGYNSYKETISHRGYMRIPYFLRHGMYLVTKWIPCRKFDFFARRGQKLRDYSIGTDRVFKDKEAHRLVKCKKSGYTKKVTAAYYDRYAGCSELKQRQAIDFYFWLINDFVHCVARSAESFGIEARFPLLDEDLLSVAEVLPDGYKLQGGLTKYAFRMAAKRVIPTDAHSRKKLGFPVPLKKWIGREDYYSEIKGKFNSHIAERYFDVKAINRLLEDYKKGNTANYKKIWAVYTFIVWQEVNFN